MSTHGLIYTRSEANIHEFVFQDVRIPTLAAFAECLKGIIISTPSDETLKILISVSAIPSLQYMIGTAREIRDSAPTRSPARIAIVYQPSLQLSLLNMVVRAAVRTSTLKLFQKKDEAQAQEWLLK